MILLVKWTLLAAVAGLVSAQNGNLLLRKPRPSTPEECARVCREGEPPRICYYRFNAELYNVLGAACKLCTPNATNTISSQCQCVQADGVERGILTINRMLPGPTIQVCEGDRVIVDLQNSMEGMEITIHWHGIRQNESQYYDGVPFVTQCPIQQGNSFRYQWMARDAGTHSWYAHTGLQKMDGLYGSIVVRQVNTKDPNGNLYDYDLLTHVILLSDWFHEDSLQMYPGKLAVNSGQVPDNILINGRGQFKDPKTGIVTKTPLEVFKMTPGKRYRLRMINSFSSACPAQLSIQGHNLTIIATDGAPVEPVRVNTIISFSGERYDFVINADQPVGAYWIQVRGLGECGTKKIMQLGVLRYSGGPNEPGTKKPTYDAALPEKMVLNPLDAICNKPRDDAVCINQLKTARPVDEGLLQQRPDVKIFLPFRFIIYAPEQLFKPNTYNHYLVESTGDHVLGLLDEISFVYPTSPPLSQIDDIPPEQFCNGDNRPADCGANCMCIHMIDIPYNAVVEVVLVDEVPEPNVTHTFHLHGYTANIIKLGRDRETSDTKMELDLDLKVKKRSVPNTKFNLPPGKDTIVVPNSGYVIFRFRADNPGYWFLNSQPLFHMVNGQNLILHVGTHEDLLPVPKNFPRCGDYFPDVM